MKSGWSRREFLKTTTAAVVLGAAEKTLAAASSSLPKRRLGKTGEMISCIGFGSGTRFCSIENEDEAQALLERALALGIDYFDTAGSYTRRGIERLSEKRRPFRTHNQKTFKRQKSAIVSQEGAENSHGALGRQRVDAYFSTVPVLRSVIN